MQNIEETYRGFIIIPSATGTQNFVASYGVWKREEDESLREVLRYSLPTQFNTTEDAHVAALIEAKAAIDREF